MKQLVNAGAVDAGMRQGRAGHPRRRQAGAAGDRRRPPPGAAQHQAQLRPARGLDQRADRRRAHAAGHRAAAATGDPRHDRCRARKTSTRTIVKRVSRKHDDEEHGGAWKVAFADFCLALMCLFLVLWLMAARNAERTEEVLRATGGKLIDEGAGRMIQSFSTARGSLIEREPVPAQGDTLQPRKALHQQERTAPRTRSRIRAVAAPLRDRQPTCSELSAVLAELSGRRTGLASNLQTIITPYGLRVHAARHRPSGHVRARQRLPHRALPPAAAQDGAAVRRRWKTRC